MPNNHDILSGKKIGESVGCNLCGEVIDTQNNILYMEYLCLEISERNVFIMKCQKCGKNEVCFHYTSSVNGCVTEKHLCSQCAAELGYDVEQMFDIGDIFGAMLPMRGHRGAFMPIAIPASAVLPFIARPHPDSVGRGDAQMCSCGQGLAEDANNGIDEEMSKRRELNAQMRIAIDNEEFEKAAELRDQIRVLEAGRISKCDTATTNSQDSQTAQ